MARRQGIFWLCTLPYDDNLPNPEQFSILSPPIVWIKGQREIGEGTGFVHWQFCVAFSSKKSLAQIKEIFGRTCHCELSRSEAAAAYVHKEETAVEGTRFELGAKPFRRNASTDWESVWNAAQVGNLDAIPANVRVVNYRSLLSIRADFDKPVSIVRTCFVFWGSTGTGKSRRAWHEAGLDAYAKDPRTKFWCGYQGI